MAMTIVEAAPGVTGGVDTHLDTHVAAALDPLGRLIGSEPFAADAAGYKALLAWLETFGEVTEVGMEGNRLLWRGPGPLPTPEGNRRSRGQPARPSGPTQSR